MPPEHEYGLGGRWQPGRWVPLPPSSRMLDFFLLLIIVSLLAAAAMGRLGGLSADAQKAALQQALGIVRSAIHVYCMRCTLPEPYGSRAPYYPSLALMQASADGPGPVLERRMFANPFALGADETLCNQVKGKDAGVTDGRHPDPGPVSGAWAYDPVQGDLPGKVPQGQPYVPPAQGFDVGQFWADTNTTGVTEFRF